MTEEVAEKRRAAARVANWLLTRNRNEEAVGVLCAWASRGANDALGQQLLAQALRLAPDSKATQQAFERMEGLEGDHQELDRLIEQHDTARLRLLESEVKGPTFRRAQIGFNNNLKAKGQAFHIQTEDSGLNSPHIITHLFADGGRVIKSHKRSYAAAMERESDIATYVRKLMKAQHLEMVLMLREGRFDEIVAGERLGGLEVLTVPPEVDPDKLRRAGQPRRVAAPRAPISQAAEPHTPEPHTPEPLLGNAPLGNAPLAAEPHGNAPHGATPLAEAPLAEAPLGNAPLAAEPHSNASLGATPLAEAPLAEAPLAAEPHGNASLGATPPGKDGPEAGAATRVAAVGPVPRPGVPGRRTGTLQMLKPSLYTLHVVRSLGDAPSRYAVAKQESVVGTGGNIKLASELFCHERHALLRFVAGKLMLHPLPCANGTFLRIYGPTFIGFGDEFIVGDQLLRVEQNPFSDDHPAPDPTYFYGSPRGQSSFRIVQIMEGGGRGACRVARGCTLQIGSAAGDWILAEDRLVDAQHCLLEEQAGSLLLTDLASQAGVFVRLRAERELVNGDEIVIGRSHLVVSIEAAGP